MSLIQNLQCATPDTIHQDFRLTIDHVLRSMQRGSDVIERLQQVREILDSLPLPTDEYATAFNRLRNAHRYLVSQERGAARYELALLAASLGCERETVTNPRRRLRMSR